MRTTDGAFNMNEPVGAMGWYPNNNPRATRRRSTST